MTDRKGVNKVRYNGRDVLTPETFSYGGARIGAYVTQSVVDDAMDCVPPVCMTSRCAQMGEPYSTRQDPDTGRWRNTFATFRRITWGRTAFGNIAAIVSAGRPWNRKTIRHRSAAYGLQNPNEPIGQAGIS